MICSVGLLVGLIKELIKKLFREVVVDTSSISRLANVITTVTMDLETQPTISKSTSKKVELKGLSLNKQPMVSKTLEETTIF